MFVILNTFRLYYSHTQGQFCTFFKCTKFSLNKNAFEKSLSDKMKTFGKDNFENGISSVTSQKINAYCCESKNSRCIFMYSIEIEVWMDSDVKKGAD